MGVLVGTSVNNQRRQKIKIKEKEDSFFLEKSQNQTRSNSKDKQDGEIFRENPRFENRKKRLKYEMGFTWDLYNNHKKEQIFLEKNQKPKPPKEKSNPKTRQRFH